MPASVRWLLPAMVACAVSFRTTANGEDWPGWRGPRGDGTSLETTPPFKWDGQSGENIVWKTPIPGVGHASPIVWQDRVFVTTCREDNDARTLLALDRSNGRVVWEQTVLHAPLEKRHKLNSRASGTPVTDGKLIFASFLDPDFASNNERTPGDLVVAAYDLSGKQQWLVRPGRFASTHGFCSSPVLFEDLVIVNGDHDGDSYVVALDQATGKERWKFARKHKTRSYVTPLIREIDGRTQLLMSGSKCVVSLDPRTGAQHWEIDGPTEQFVASMVYNGKYAFLTAGFPDRHILAIKPDGTGNVTHTHIVWRTTRNCSYVPSPVLSGDYLLVAADDGISSCFVADTGERVWMERMAPHYSASLVSTTNGLAYFLADDGVTKIVKPGKEYQLVAENELGESCYASPAFSDGQIFIRSDQHLFAIGPRRP